MCYAETGRPRITLKWVDRNKGNQENENYRSRLIVRELKPQGQAVLIPEYPLFLSMPPLLEALKLMCSLLVTSRASRSGGAMALKLTDISRAHFYGISSRRIFVTLPEGDEEEGKCGFYFAGCTGHVTHLQHGRRIAHSFYSKMDFLQERRGPVSL